MPQKKTTADNRKVIAAIPPRINRSFSYCDKRHNNYGHTCRHQIWEQAQGEYILYVDDDDYLADKDVLKTLDAVTEAWAVFPALRHGTTIFNVPPIYGGTGTGMFIHKKEIGRWPDSDSYEADGVFIEALKANYPYQVLNSRPLVVLPVSSCGVSNAETWWGSRLAILLGRWIWYRRSPPSSIRS